MKTYSVKVYALAVFGLCSAHRDFVLAHHVPLVCISTPGSADCFQRGLKIKISPAVKPSSTGDSNGEVKPNKLLYRKACHCVGQIDEVGRKWEYASTSHAYPCCLRFKNQINVNQHNGLEVEGRLQHKVGDHTYYTGWKLRGTLLRKWITRKELQISKTSTMDPQAFITEYDGTYSHEWKAQGPVLHIGHTGVPANTAVREFSPIELRGCTTNFLSTVEYEQNIVLQLGNEATQIPAKVHDSLQKLLTSLNFELLRDGRYQGECNYFSTHIEGIQRKKKIQSRLTISDLLSPDPHSFKLHLQDHFPLIFHPFQYYILKW
uniref:AlNc14C86G5514 protein n=1 Tax=Albugo laibachii Nc14 TaxID=890382 RepID=F0WFY1_9STRA|nr:AlNc14C86G5514 [Albugo laibachii Nc14]|eukprot:CCA20115.1 AlNc14C86G5514 [Albugo laibachii Nc14]